MDDLVDDPGYLLLVGEVSLQRMRSDGMVDTIDARDDGALS
jgi:hypothetical protein